MLHSLKLIRRARSYMLSMKKIVVTLLIIVICSVIPSVAISVYANSLLLNNAEEINSKGVATLSSTVDSALINLINKADFISINQSDAYSTLSRPISKYSPEFINASKTISRFTAEFTSDLNIIDSVFVYFKSSDYLIASSGSFDHDYYIQRYYAYQDYPLSYWNNLTKAKSDMQILPITNVYRKDANNNKSYYKTIMPIVVNPDKNGQIRNIVVINVDQQKIMDLIHGLNVSDSGVIFILDPNHNKIISSTDGGVLENSLKYSLTNLQSKTGSGVYEYRESNKLYEIMYRHSSETNLIYAAITPKTVIEKQIYLFSFSTVSIILLSAILLMAIASCLISLIYKSVSPEVEMLTKTFKIPGISTKDQFYSLKQGVEYVCNQNEANMQVIMEMFFYRAIQNRICKDDVTDFISKYSRFGEYRCFRLIYIQSNFCFSPHPQLTSQQKNDAYHDITDILSQYTEIVINNKPNNYVMFLFDDNNNSLSLKTDSLCERLQSFADGLLGKLELIVAVGDSYYDLVETSDHFNQAVNILNNRGIAKEGGGENIFGQDDLSANLNAIIPPKVKQSLYAMTANNLNNAALELVKKYNKALLGDNIAFVRFKLINYDLIFIAFEIINSHSLNIHEVFQSDEKELLGIYDSLISVNGILSFCDMIYMQTSRALSLLQTEQNGTDTMLINYIETHIDTVNLCVLSEQLNMNQNYVSQYFKKHFGVTFYEYLSRKRIDKAKHLLHTTRLSGNKIGQLVGFSDSNAFIRMFKKLEGITPNEFRKEYLFRKDESTDTLTIGIREEQTRSAWNMVDENFRITPTLEKTFAAKQAEFAAQIKKLIPEITDDQIEQFRQAVAGEINKGKAAIVGQTQDEQGNGLTTTDDAETATTPAPQTDAQASPDEQATFPGIGNVTLGQIDTCIEAAKIAITKTTDAAELNTLNLSLSALQTLRTAKAAESKTAAPNSVA